MLSSSVDAAGRKVTDRGNKTISVDVAKLLKTQDANYLRTMLQMVRKEREEIEQRVMLSDDKIQAFAAKGGRKKHTAFVKDQDEQANFDEEEWSGVGKGEEVVPESEDEEEGRSSRPKKVTKKQLEAKQLAEKEERNRKSSKARTYERVYAHLKNLKTKEKDLMTAERELELQRAKMAGTIGGVNKNGVKFKVRERKR